jgi:hypothetical protein
MLSRAKWCHKVKYDRNDWKTAERGLPHVHGSQQRAGREGRACPNRMLTHQERDWAGPAVATRYDRCRSSFSHGRKMTQIKSLDLQFPPHLLRLLLGCRIQCKSMKHTGESESIL